MAPLLGSVYNVHISDHNFGHQAKLSVVPALPLLHKYDPEIMIFLNFIKNGHLGCIMGLSEKELQSALTSVMGKIMCKSRLLYDFIHI